MIDIILRLWIGSDIWAYGLAGPGQGSYAVFLDSKLVGEYTAKSETPDFKYLLHAAHGLEDGKKHTLTLENTVEGMTLGVDVAIISSSEYSKRSTPSA